MHASHAVWPGSFWKVPASHCLHVSCLIASVYVPAAHAVAASEPTEQKEPAVQSTHWLSLDITIVWSDGLCVPPGHGSAAAAPLSQ